MSRRAAKFTEADVRRVLSGARKAGVDVRVEITADKITVFSGCKPSESETPHTMTPDDELKQWRDRKNAG